jgi:two-component system response regulator AtoC
MFRVLLADDAASIRLALGDALEHAGYHVKRVSDGAEALRVLEQEPFDLVIADISMPLVDGIKLFRKISAEHSDTAVILMTAFAKLTDAVAALKDGALDYVEKPFELDEMLIRVERVRERRNLVRELQTARAQAKGRSSTDIVAHSSVMVSALERIDAIARSGAPVLLVGESGTGKELAARRLHDMSERSGRPMVAVNCAAFPESLIEAELFGYERGAFTGAMQKREGRFKAADGGTLFLDEVAEIPLPVQAKLLRVLQEGSFERIGSNDSVKVDVRIVSATHRNLRQRIAQGQFREDLYYRLNAIEVRLPPLRERRGDLPILIEHFVQRAIARGAKAPKGISPSAFAALTEYPFPGNVRELQHAVEHAAVLARGEEIQIAHLPRDIANRALGGPREHCTAGDGFRPLEAAIKEFEREYMLRGLAVAGGKKAKAAELLGISRKSLWEKLRANT